VLAMGERRASSSYVRSQSLCICTRSSGKPFRTMTRLEHLFDSWRTSRHAALGANAAGMRPDRQRPTLES
jgi:hypothetical protein